MPTNIVDVSTFTAPIVTPASADPRTAASVATAVQGLANRARYLRNAIEGTLAGAQIPYGQGRPEGVTLTGWQISSNWLAQNDVSVTGRWMIDLSREIPSGVTVTEVQALAHGNAFAVGTHGGSMPTGAGRPEMQFIEMTSGAITYSVAQPDTAVDGGAGAYEVDHAITLTVNRVVDPVCHYFVSIKGETGGNALNTRFAVKALSISWTGL